MLTRHLGQGAQDPKTPTQTFWGTHGDTEAARRRASTSVPQSGDSSRLRNGRAQAQAPPPRARGPKLQPGPLRAPHRTPVPRPGDPGPWWPVSPATQSELGHRGPRALTGPGFLLGRRAGERLRKPAARGLRRAYISRQLFLPRATRKPGGPGLPLPRLVKPALQHPRPGCCQRPEPTTGAQRPTNLPPQNSKHNYLHNFAAPAPPHMVLLQCPSDGSQTKRTWDRQTPGSLPPCPPGPRASSRPLLAHSTSGPSRQVLGPQDPSPIPSPHSGQLGRTGLSP